MSKKAEPEAVAEAPYPRQLENGRWVTDETPPRSFADADKERAVARQKAIEKGASA